MYYYILFTLYINILSHSLHLGDMLLIHVQGSVQISGTVPSLIHRDQSCILVRVSVLEIHELNTELEASVTFITSKLNRPLEWLHCAT